MTQLDFGTTPQRRYHMTDKVHDVVIKFRRHGFRVTNHGRQHVVSGRRLTTPELLELAKAYDETGWPLRRKQNQR